VNEKLQTLPSLDDEPINLMSTSDTEELEELESLSGGGDSHKRTKNTSPIHTTKVVEKESDDIFRETLYKKGPGSKSSAFKRKNPDNDGTECEAKKKLDMNVTKNIRKTGAAAVSKSCAPPYGISSSTSRPGQAQDDGCDRDAEISSIDEWSSAHSTSTRGRHHKRKDNPYLEVLQERSKIMEKLTDNIAAVSSATLKSDMDTADSLWARSLVMQMSRMTQDVKDVFMVKVFKMAMDAIAGKLPE
jgi:hypothetical protein